MMCMFNNTGGAYVPSCFYLKSQKLGYDFDGKVRYKYSCISGPGGNNLSSEDIENYCKSNYFKKCARYKRR